MIEPLLENHQTMQVMDSSAGNGIRAEVTDVTFRNEENGWTVLNLKNQDNGRPFPAVGVFSFIRTGEILELFGQWTDHKKFGKQFKIERSVVLRPKSPKEILKYLGSGMIKGIGPKTAKCIVEHFGESTLDVLDQSPQKLLQVPKIGQKKLHQIIAVWEESRGQRELQIFLASHQISEAFAAKIQKKYGDNAHLKIAANPYSLATDISGIGFVKADKIAMSLGIPKDSLDRVKAAVLYLLKQAADTGHCFLTTNDLVKTLQEKLDLELSAMMHKITTAVIELNQDGLLVSESIPGQNLSAHYLPHLYRAEVRLSTNLRDRLKSTRSDLDQQRRLAQDRIAADPILSPLQKNAVVEALGSHCFILTGGPGVGKTTTANAIIRLFMQMSKRILLGAPTGRAAQRLAEVSGQDDAKTIHRLLEWAPELGTFTRNSTNPLECDVLLLDEASMLDLPLADAVVDALPENAQLILLGDADQLPSVGPGNVLRQLIEAKIIPTVHLDQIFRQGKTSDIIEFAHMMNHGQVPEFRSDEQSDCKIILAEQPRTTLEALRSLFVSDYFPKRGLNPIRDVQVLSPMNKGELGTTHLNLLLQSILNPDPTQLPSSTPALLLDPTAASEKIVLTYRLGDKVIQTSNNYDLGVFNGDIGWVLEKKGQQLTVQFGDRLVVYAPEQVRELQLAYAITIHKSQGSEFPAVILLASMSHFIMLQRNLYYTGLTRARRLAIFLGSSRAITQAVKTQTSLNRRTLLLKRMLA